MLCEVVVAYVCCMAQGVQSHRCCLYCPQVIELSRQQEITKQQDGKQKEAELRAQAAQLAKVLTHAMPSKC